MNKNFTEMFAICNALDMKLREEYLKYDEEFTKLIFPDNQKGYYIIQLNDCYGMIPVNKMVKLARKHGIFFDYVKGTGYNSNKTAKKLGSFIDSLEKDLGDTQILLKAGDSIPDIKNQQYTTINESTGCLVYTKTGEWVDIDEWIMSFDSAYCIFYSYQKNGMTINLNEKLDYDSALSYAQTLAKMLSNKSITVIARRVTEEDKERCYNDELLRRQAIRAAMIHCFRHRI